MKKIIIDLGEYKLLKEQSLATFGSVLKYTLQSMFGLNRPNLTVRGSRSEIDKFVAALAGEKKYMESYLKYGLNDPRTLSNKFGLRNSVAAFERETGILWPFK